MTETKSWIIAVCPECNEVELWSEKVVVYCATCGRRLVDDAVEVVPRSKLEAIEGWAEHDFEQAEVNRVAFRAAEAEVKQLRAALGHISALCQMEGGELAHRIWHEAEEALARPILTKDKE